MNGRFHSEDNDLRTSAVLSKNNSPWPFFGVFVLIAGIATSLYFLFSSASHVSQPILNFSNGQVIVTSQVNNHTAKPQTITLRFDIIYSYSGTKASPAFDLSLDHREISFTLGANSSRIISCEFPMPKDRSPNTATAKIISCK